MDPRPRARAGSAFAATLLMAIVSACTDERGDPVVPAVPVAAEPPPAVVSGSFNVPVPPNSAATFDNFSGWGYQDWTAIGVDASAGDLLRVSVQGQLDVTQAPNCTAPIAPGTVGPEGLGNGDWRVVAHVGALPPFFTFSNVPLTPDAGGVSGSILPFSTGPLSVARHGTGDGLCSDGTSVEAFLMTSSQTLSYEILDPLTGSLSATALALGDSTTFTVTPGQDVVVDAWAWQFVPGDTLSSPGGPPAPFAPNQCDSIPTACTFSPTESGRLWVQADLEELFNGFAYEASEVIVVGPAFSVSLACDDPVTRGQTVTCDVTVDPDTANLSVVDFSWSFAGEELREFPNGVPFAIPDTIEFDGMGETRWQGTAVLSGMVSVDATWNGLTRSASDTLEVTPRNWTLPASLASTVAKMPTDLSVGFDDQSADSLGNATPGAAKGVQGQNYDLRTLSANWSRIIDGGHPGELPDSVNLASVPAGPNKGLWYVEAAKMGVRRGVRIRDWLLKDGTKQFKPLQGGKVNNRKLLQLTIQNHPTFSDDSTGLVDGILRHERMGTSGQGRGHQEQLERFATDTIACGDARALLEPLVTLHNDPNLQTAMRFIVQKVATQATLTLGRASSHFYVFGNRSGPTPVYEVEAQVTNTANAVLLHAAVDGKTSSLPTEFQQPTTGSACDYSVIN